MKNLWNSLFGSRKVRSTRNRSVSIPMTARLEERVVMSAVTVQLTGGVLNIDSTDPINEIKVERQWGNQIRVDVEQGHGHIYNGTFALADVASIALTGVGELDLEQVGVPVTFPDGQFGVLTGTNVSATVVDRVLSVAGSAGNDNVQLDLESGFLEVEVKSAPGSYQPSSHVYFDRTAIDSVIYTNNGGNDRLNVDRWFPIPVQSDIVNAPPIGTPPNSNITVTPPGVTATFGTSGVTALLDATGVLTVTGTSLYDKVQLERTNNGLIKVEVNVLGREVNQYFSASAVQNIVYLGQGGNDSLEVSQNPGIMVTSPDTTPRTSGSDHNNGSEHNNSGSEHNNSGSDDHSRGTVDQSRKSSDDSRSRVTLPKVTSTVPKVTTTAPKVTSTNSRAAVKVATPSSSERGRVSLPSASPRIKFSRR